MIRLFQHPARIAAPVVDRKHFRLALAFAVLAVILRAPAVLYPVFGEEEAAEASVAALVAGGGELYRDAAAPEAPLGYWISAAVYDLFGLYSQRAVHVLAIVTVLLTMAALAFAARALGGDRAAPLAALFYGVFAAVQPPEALGASAELWMALAQGVAGWLVLGGAPQGRYGVLFGAGALGALGALLRHAGHAFAAAALAYLLLWRPLLLGRARLGEGARGALSFALGYAILYSIPLGYLQGRGTLGAFAASAWSSSGAAGGAVRAVQITMALVGPLLLWLLTARDLGDSIRRWCRGGPRGEEDAAQGFALSWLAAAALAATLRGRGAPEDLLPLLTPLALCAARGAAAIADDFWAGKLALAFRLGVAVPAAAFFCAALMHDPLYRALGAQPPRARHAAEVVRDGSTPGDRLWVVGDARRVYVYARRAPAARFVHPDGHAAAIPPEVRSAPPPWVVDAGGPRDADVDAWLERLYVTERVVEGARVLRRRAR
jgi:hypothetical protein